MHLKLELKKTIVKVQKQIKRASETTYLTLRYLTPLVLITQAPPNNRGVALLLELISYVV